MAKKKISKHKQAGKHSLDYDIIFKGKKEKIDENTNLLNTGQEKFNYDPSSYVYEEVMNNENYIRTLKVKQCVYDVLSEKTDYDFDSNRRKPSSSDFNRYFVLLKRELKKEGFTNVELFNELAIYFSDNLFNMLKLLDNEWRNLIIKELEKHIGKPIDEDKEINKKNLKEGTEIEFLFYDEYNSEVKKITGIIEGYDEDEDVFKVNSFENTYFVPIDSINEILKHHNYKYNLNKIKNLDFL